MRSGLLRDLFCRHARCHFYKRERAIVVGAAEHSEVGDNHVDHIGAGQRQSACRDELGCFWVSVGRDEEATRRAMAEKIAYYGGAFAPHLVEKVGVDPVEMAKVSELLETHGLDTAVSHVTDQMLQLGMVGTPEQVVDRCRGLIQLGARHLSFGPPLGPDPLAAISVLGSEVLAPLRADGGL